MAIGNVDCFKDACQEAAKLGAKFYCRTNINGHITYTFVKSDQPLTLEESNAITAPLYTVSRLGSPYIFHEVGYYMPDMDSFTPIDRVNGCLMPKVDNKDKVHISGLIYIPENYL